MKNYIDNPSMDKVVLVSGDGDYCKTVDYLVEKNKFKHILFPNGKFASSLYNNLDNKLKTSMNRLEGKMLRDKK